MENQAKKVDIDIKARCFLCLEEAIVNKNDKVRENNKISSFQNIEELTKMEVVKAINGQLSLSLPFLLKVTIKDPRLAFCVDCAIMANRISGLCGKIEKIQREINALIKTVQRNGKLANLKVTDLAKLKNESVDMTEGLDKAIVKSNLSVKNPDICENVIGTNVRAIEWTSVPSTISKIQDLDEKLFEIDICEEVMQEQGLLTVLNVDGTKYEEIDYWDERNWGLDLFKGDYMVAIAESDDCDSSEEECLTDIELDFGCISETFGAWESQRKPLPKRWDTEIITISDSDSDSECENGKGKTVCKKGSRIKKVTTNNESIPQRKTVTRPGYKYKCGRCSIRFLTKWGIVRHLQKCSVSGSSTSKIVRPQVTPTPPKCQPKIAATCWLCKKIFPSAANLRKHQLRYHLGIRRFPCEMCNLRFKESGHLKTHKESVHFGLKFGCVSGCSRTYRKKYSLTRHQQKCHFFRKFKANGADHKARATVILSTCSEILKKSGDPSTSRKIIFPRSSAKTKLNSSSENMIRKRAKVDPSRTTKIVVAGSSHSLDKNGNDKTLTSQAKNPEGSEPVIQNENGPAAEATSSKSGRRKQIISVLEHPDSLHSCEICGNRFRTRFHLESHLEIHENILQLENRKFSCNICNTTFSKQGNLKQHYEAVHLKIKSSCVAGCSKWFTCKLNLRKHQRRCDTYKKYFVNGVQKKTN